VRSSERKKRGTYNPRSRCGTWSDPLPRWRTYSHPRGSAMSAATPEIHFFLTTHGSASVLLVAKDRTPRQHCFRARVAVTHQRAIEPMLGLGAEALRTPLAGSARALRESVRLPTRWVAREKTWLTHNGHVVDFAIPHVDRIERPLDRLGLEFGLPPFCRHADLERGGDGMRRGRGK
jgi:hypothetical protein